MGLKVVGMQESFTLDWPWVTAIDGGQNIKPGTPLVKVHAAMESPAKRQKSQKTLSSFIAI